MLILSNEEIERLLTMPECMAILREMYIDIAENRTLTIARVDSIVPCSQDDGYYAFKYMGGIWSRHNIVALRLNSDTITHPMIGNSRRRVKVPRANGRYVGLVQLYSTETGELLAMFPDGVAQRMRVGAANGIGLDLLGRKDARRVGLIGSGWQAGAQLMAALAVRPNVDVKVYSIRKDNREQFAADWQKQGVNIRAVDSAEECARDVDVLIAATSSLAPVIRREWLCPGMYISTIKLQEVDQSVLDRCDRVVAHNKIELSQIDNILPGTPNVQEQAQNGWWNQSGNHWDDYSSLSDVLVGRAAGRQDDKEITCFVNNMGFGLQFAALGVVLIEKAKQLDIGTTLPAEWFSETVHP